MAQCGTVLVGGAEVDATPYTRFLHLLFRLCKAGIGASDTVRSTEGGAELHPVIAEELLQSPRVPTSVVLDEAIELARRFGNSESGAFVNGVLDAIAARLGVKDDRTRSGDSDEP